MLKNTTFTLEDRAAKIMKKFEADSLVLKHLSTLYGERGEAPASSYVMVGVMPQIRKQRDPVILGRLPQNFLIFGWVQTK